MNEKSRDSDLTATSKVLDLSEKSRDSDLTATSKVLDLSEKSRDSELKATSKVLDSNADSTPLNLNEKSTVFDHIQGNDHIKVCLTRMVETDHIPHSLLFSGPEGVGKSAFAKAFAKLIVQTDHDHHSDIRHYHPEGKIGMHSVESLREFNEAVYMAPFEAKKKVFIIHEADRMLSYSANALLKTFEEPALNSVIILISHSTKDIWPTVLSRCQNIRFQPVSSTQLLRNSRVPESVRKVILNTLADHSYRHYPTLLKLKSDIYEEINRDVLCQGDTLRAELLGQYADEPTAIQKNEIEQEVEGLMTMQRTREGHAIFQLVLSWYRDLYLLRLGGDRALLMNPDYTELMEKVIEEASLPSLESVQKHVADVKLLLRRATSLDYCIENLFLRLS